MLKYFIDKSVGKKTFRKPRIAVCIPSGATEVEKKAVEDAVKALRDARFAEAQAAAKAQEAEDKIRVDKSKLEKKIQDKIAEIKVLNAQLAEISKQRIALEAKAKELDVVVTSAKQVKDAADQDLKDLEESIAKLKKIIAKLLELAK